jgi:hypothetical protein
MDKLTLSSYIRDNLKETGQDKEPGPFVTISRQFGCDGYEIADLLAEKLNQMASDEHHWKVYKREILKRVAEESGISEEIIERERQAKPNFVRDLCRSIRNNKLPDGMEILKAITTIVRIIAFDGYAIIVGHGATAATAEIDNGLNIRLEAPREWRLKRLCRRDGLTFQEAENLIKETETGRKHLDQIYQKWNPRTPAFSLMLDNSAFTNEEIVDHIIMALKHRNLIKEKTTGTTAD